MTSSSSAVQPVPTASAATAIQARSTRTFRNRLLISQTLFEWRKKSLHVNFSNLANRPRDQWQASWPPPPATAQEALNSSGCWSAAACGVEILRCRDDRTKGSGAFALVAMPADSLVGCYWGELMTRRMAHVRHGWNNGAHLSDLSSLEQADLEARERRLGALTHGAPTGGSINGGKYFFELTEPGSAWQRERRAHGSDSSGGDDHLVGIDGEDPTRSSWARFINNAPPFRSNLLAQMDPLNGRIWFVAKREIAAGEELLFTYSDEGMLLYLWRKAGGWTLAWLVLVAAVAASRSDELRAHAGVYIPTSLQYPAAGALLVSMMISVGHLLARWTSFDI